jgi:signal transduction histidine kinase
MVPLGSAERVRGVLVLGRRPGRLPFGDGSVPVVRSFADQAALALALAATRIDTERLVILEDRDRIARDLHDVVIQRIFASAMTLLSTIKLIDHPAAAVRIRDTVDDLDDTIRQIRSTIFALQTEHGADGPTLRVRVHAAVEAGASALGFMPGLEIEGPVDTVVPDTIGQQVVTVIGEALTNVARHARARHVTVRLSAGDDVSLTVTDDGVGIEPGGRRSGLRNLAERAGALGGTFDVAPGPTVGTILRWRVPLPRSGAL